MKRLTIAISTAALLAGGAAYAQSADRNADTTRAEAIERTAERFAKMDANDDGVLDAEDREARAGQMFDRLDANGDGMISRTEFETHHAERREQRAERRGERGERQEREWGRRGGRGHRGDMAMMRRADTDGNGAISQAEFQAAALARFDRADADNNGVVTAAEKQSARAAMRETRQQRRGN
ncbi:EF-hand domain-containing protein [Alteriqipengyuania flavescens]|uniref:EF-hand domain-containing protein n=1 Tax=Alteriqipengyuania flavescens TaxID=3053610 RepID=UPI0025B37740|nr:EF-hand domain-containing protein [Alteriqipengyuania flavescens]WJY19370.1 EF-hand domain-containing protein [Alteriqipengyuania flavescens]WJY25312.1 EF-hand domain-containing protein [Alteriqipengyuania flavescens]